jgi:hypothetical protein
LEINGENDLARDGELAELNLVRGLASMKSHVESMDDELQLAFANLEAQLLGNIQAESTSGSNEATRSERNRIVMELNRLAIGHMGHTFNDLCRG